MSEISSLEDLRQLRERIIADEADDRPTIVVCAGTACQASESNRIIRSVKKYLMFKDLVDQVKLRVTGCHGFCEMGPFILTDPQRAFYVRLHHYHVPRIIDALLAGEYVEELLYKDPVTGERFFNCDEIPFFSKQQRTLLGQNQAIDPIRLFDYLANGGYGGLEKVIAQNDPDGIINEVKQAGLRGRGGAGFLAGRKWELARQQPSEGGKYVVCNADEGDPGAYMDRSILEGNPHSVIEGMSIGGIAMGANEGFIFVRHEYPQAIKNTLIGLRVAREHGLLGKNILGSGIDFDINIVKSAGAFVCGEETALIKTIEGFMGEPIQRPPYPIEKGIYGRPTCINNVETWANVPIIIKGGAKAYAEVGTPKSTGTKVFSLVGKIKNTGLVEVPMGISISEIVFDIGGGPQPGRKIKAVQIGGPSGGCIPAKHFDLAVDYDSLAEAGAIMGSGGMIVMDDDTCMVDVAKYFMAFLMDESCGKCFTCRKGTQRMWELLDDITSGRGTLGHLDLLEELALVVKDTTMCGLGQSAPNPVLSTLRHFRHEYERHIVDKRCDAYVCSDLVGAPCQSACPIGTEAWRYTAHIASGEFEEAYLAIRETNPFPSVCARVCDHKCESRCRLGTSGKDPVAIRTLKRFVTDTVDPAIYRPSRAPANGRRVAIVGAGPAGLTAAHSLSLEGYSVTVVDAADHAGGMLSLGIPEYRLPREVMRKEIDALLDDNIELRLNTTLGKDLTIDDLIAEGFEAVFLALGALKSRRLMITGEDVEGVYPSMQFLRAFNHQQETVAKGRVGVIGGGNSALDAARVARRQKGVDKVTIFYRRTRDEMPAFAEEIEAALEEGIELVTLVTPVRVLSEGGVLRGLEFLKNGELGDRDASGRRSPVPVSGSEFSELLDTLVVAISEKPDVDNLFEADNAGLEATSWGSIAVDDETLTTGRPAVFAGGDVVTGPNTVVDAIAAGKRAALSIDRYLRGDALKQPRSRSVPKIYVEPVEADSRSQRVKPAVCEATARQQTFIEVEQTLTEGLARQEAQRCLRCDLEYTQPAESELAPVPLQAAGAHP